MLFTSLYHVTPLYCDRASSHIHTNSATNFLPNALRAMPGPGERSMGRVFYVMAEISYFIPRIQQPEGSLQNLSPVPFLK